MNLEFNTKVLIIRDFPQFKLVVGDTAMVIEYLPHPEGGEEG